MATFVTLSLPQAKQELFKPAFNIIKTMDETFSTYNPQAYAYQLNQSKSLQVPKLFLELLYRCRTLYHQTLGYFSVAIGAITKKSYRFGEKEARVPTEKELDRANTDLLGFTVEDDTVTLDKDVVIDFGGVAKGFTVDKVRDFLKTNGIKKFRIALSGDIYCKGSCDIAIQSPFVANKVMKVLHLKDSAISTSGNYERYIKSKKHNHLINPKTKRSQQSIASMTLYSKKHDNTTLDALATALSVMPKKIRTVVLRDFPDISFVIVTSKGEVDER